MANSLKFGTSGLRGLASELVGEEARRYAAAFVRYLRAGGWGGSTMLVGRDLRDSSPAIFRDVAEAMGAFGIEVRDAGEVPTPALALAAQTQRLPAIMVTGSHIPGDRNGMKFYRADGSEIDKDDEAGVLAAVADAPEGVARIVPDAGVRQGYLDRYRNFAPPSVFSDLRSTFGIWQHSSVARDVLTEILRDLGAPAVAFGRSESFVPVDTEAVSAELVREPRAWIERNGQALVLSTDGDGDRPLVIDEAGEVVPGDILGMFTARLLKADAVVTPITSISSVEGFCADAKVFRTKVGSPYVIAGMREAAAEGFKRVLGFEANGGVLLGFTASSNGNAIAPLPTRDAVLPILCTLAFASNAGESVHGVVGALPQRFARSDRLQNVPPQAGAALIETLKSGLFTRFEKLADRVREDHTDGYKAWIHPADIVHFRPSGNAPELRCYVEAGSAAEADALLKWAMRAAADYVSSPAA